MNWWRGILNYNIPPGFFGVDVESTFRGNALSIKVENESIIIKLVFLGGKLDVVWVSKARRWDKVGVEKWLNLLRISHWLKDSADGNACRIWPNLGPDIGCDASGNVSLGSCRVFMPITLFCIEVSRLKGELRREIRKCRTNVIAKRNGVWTAVLCQ